MVVIVAFPTSQVVTEYIQLVVLSVVVIESGAESIEVPFFLTSIVILLQVGNVSDDIVSQLNVQAQGVGVFGTKLPQTNSQAKAKSISLVFQLPPLGVCHVAVVLEVAVNTCQVVGAVAELTFIVVVADFKALVASIVHAIVEEKVLVPAIVCAQIVDTFQAKSVVRLVTDDCAMFVRVLSAQLIVLFVSVWVAVVPTTCSSIQAGSYTDWYISHPHPPPQEYLGILRVFHTKVAGQELPVVVRVIEPCFQSSAVCTDVGIGKSHNSAFLFTHHCTKTISSVNQGLQVGVNWLIFWFAIVFR